LQSKENDVSNEKKKDALKKRKKHVKKEKDVAKKIKNNLSFLP